MPKLKNCPVCRKSIVNPVPNFELAKILGLDRKRKRTEEDEPIAKRIQNRVLELEKQHTQEQIERDKVNVDTICQFIFSNLSNPLNQVKFGVFKIACGSLIHDSVDSDSFDSNKARNVRQTTGTTLMSYGFSLESLSN